MWSNQWSNQWSSQSDQGARVGFVDQGNRWLGKMQGYVLGHTPLETERVCTDCLFIPLFLAALLGFHLCIAEAWEKGGFQRLTALPDFEGNLCGSNGQGPYLYFCQAAGGLDFQHQICLESCPADSSSQIFCRGTGTQQMSYATHPLAGMICMPTAAELASETRQGQLLMTSSCLGIGMHRLGLYYTDYTAFISNETLIR
eukprot:Skav224517  [mRNA]  locus=scaffold4480:68760:69583:+ [translate_table: standard]